jgi:DNA helicase II / ATP-dependent DNA helicase PcrA
VCALHVPCHFCRLNAIASRFQHVLVDEYQDTNPIQAAILRKLWTRMTTTSSSLKADAPPTTDRSLMAVGDDAQSIYSFRGATVENILNFVEHFPGSTTITLEQNYRSVTPILDAANAVMRGAPRRFTKNLWSERESAQKPALVTCADELEQSKFVVERVLEHREEGIPLTRQAVLFRATQAAGRC